MPSDAPTRRAALQGLGAVALSPLVGCGDGDDTGLGSAATVDDPWALMRQRIDTVVVVMMENRSFDHYLGALSLEEGRDDVDGLAPGMSNPRPDGTAVEPFVATIDCLADPPHSWSACHDQFADGANDGFVTTFEARHPGMGDHVMGYWGRDMLPALYTFADHYTVCDQWYCSLLTSTWPNRYYLHAGTSGGIGDNRVPGPDDTFDSIYGRILGAGRTWGAYYANLPSLVVLPDIDLGDSRMQVIERFFERAAAGTLPNYVFIDPLYGENDDHPPTHPLSGQIFLAQIYEALASSPQWERAVLIITYDEHGGFFDHVPPPTAPDDHKRDGFDQLGFRVPSLVIGPWVKARHVSHVAYDHASVLAFVEALWELQPLTKRDAAADPLLDCFDLDALATGSPLQPAPLAPIVADLDVIGREACTWLGIFRDGPSAGRHPTGQPELEAFADAHLRGTRLDRREQTPAIRDWLLERAVERGVLIPT